MFPSSSRKPRARATSDPSSASSSSSDSEPEVENATSYDAARAESHRERFRLQGKPGYERVLDALRREQTSLRETRQYLFGRLLILQLEEAVLRDHLNSAVNANGDAAGGAEVEARKTKDRA